MTFPFLFREPPASDDDTRRSPLRLVQDRLPAAPAASADGVNVLAARIREGDHAAFTEFVEAYYERVVRVAWSIVRSRETAQDIAQDVFVRIWERRRTIPAEQLTTAYILTMAYHRALNDVKRNRVRERYRHEISTADAGMTPRLDESVLIRTMVASALDTMPDRWRVALHLRFQEQLAVPEVAAVLGITPNATHQLLYRAVRELRRLLGEKGKKGKSGK